MKLLKYALSSILCNAVRFVRILPNNDPIMAFMLPFSRQDKWFHSAVFAFLTMFLFDIFTSGIGVWTWITAVTYACLGVAAHFLFKRTQKVSLKAYLGVGVVSVLVFDLVTGVFFGPVLFGVPIWAAFLGQIPFTLLHLLTVSFYIVVLTPFLDRHLIGAQVLEDSNIVALAKMRFKNMFFAR